jgi:hypothetical protein
MERICGNCAFYDRAGVRETEQEPTAAPSPGFCRRYPPTLVAPHSQTCGLRHTTAGFALAEFPVTCADDWCAEWQRGPGKGSERPCAELTDRTGD